MDKSSIFDVVIVGAGPAGSTTAKYAALNGIKVLLLDQREQIGVPVRCGEYLPSIDELRVIFPAVKEIDEIFQIDPKSFSRALTSTHIITPQNKVYKLKFSGFTMERSQFDLSLAQQAQKSGVMLMTNTRVTKVAGNTVFTNQGAFSGKVIVGADGPLSVVADGAGMRKPDRLALAIKCEVAGDFGDIVKMYFGELAPGGYAWVIPKKNSANIGLGIQSIRNGVSLNELLMRFLEFLGLDISQATEIATKPIPMSGQVPRITKDNILLVGDAAGQLMPCNGGGIPVAMICGRIAGATIAAHITKGLALNNYEISCRIQVGQVLQHSLMLKRMADITFRDKRLLELSIQILGARGMGQILRCHFPLTRIIPELWPL